MKTLLSILWFAATAIPAVCQKPLYLKKVSFYDYNVTAGKETAGGFSAIEYDPDSQRWVVVSDQDKKNGNSHVFNIDLLENDLNLAKWNLGPKLDQSGVESYRFNKQLNKYFAAVEKDNESFIAEIRSGKVIRLHPARNAVRHQTFNRGIEGLTFMAATNELWYAYESGNSTDCDKENFTLFYKVEYDAKSGSFDFKNEKSYKYKIDRCGCLDKNQPFDGQSGNGVSEILAYAPDQFMILERCYNKKTDKSQARIILGKVDGDSIVRTDTLFDFENLPECYSAGNLEGMSFGPNESGSSRTVYLISDNNNDPSEKTRLIVLSEKQPDEGANAFISQNKPGLDLVACATLLSQQPGKPLDVAKPGTDSLATEKLNQNKTVRTPSIKSRRDKKPKQSITFRFEQDGSLTSKMPRFVPGPGKVLIELKAPKSSALGKSLEKRFDESLAFIASQDTVSPILKLLCLDSARASAMVRRQKESSYTPFFKKSIQYHVALNGNTYPLTSSSDSLWSTTVDVPKAADDREKQSVTLTKTNDGNVFFKQVLANTKARYQPWATEREYFDTLYAEYSFYAKRIDGLLLQNSLLGKASKSCNCPKYNESLAVISNELCELIEKIKPSQVQLCALATRVIEQNACWIGSWLWYTGGKPKLNPFGMVSVAEYNSQVDKRLAVAEAQLQMYNEFSKQRGLDPLLTQEKFLKPRITTLAAIVSNLKSLKETAGRHSKDTEDWLATTSETKKILNKVLLYSTNDSTIHWMNHYDASDGFQKMNGKDQLPERVYEKDAVHGIVHNLTAKQKVSAVESVTKTELRTELDLDLEPLTDALASALSVVSSQKAAPIPDKPGESITSDTSKITKTGCTPDIGTYQSSRQLITWLSEQTEPPLADIEGAFNKFDIAKAQPAYRSQETLVNESRSVLGTNIVSYEIFEEGNPKPVVKDKYQTYENVRFWPFISLNYVNGSRASSIFDNTTNTFKAYTEMDNFEVFAGAKWYFGPSNVTRTPSRSKFIKKTVGSAYQASRGNGIGGKAFLFLGLGIRHKFLKNYGAGAGIDIVPGLSASAGVNMYFDKKYEIVNGLVRRDFDVAKFRVFFGLGIDVNVVTRFVNLF